MTERHWLAWIFVCVMVLVCGLLILATPAKAQGQTLREWFNQLRSPGGGQCCLNFDGASLEETGWRTAGNGYQVLIEGTWVDVPPDRVVDVPNRLGRAHLWLNGGGAIRCFIPGSLG